MTPPLTAGYTALYDEEYFARHCGSLPMSRLVPDRIEATREAATRIAEALRPSSVFEAGCAIGLLVEALWDRGITTHGRDLSSYALAQAREDIQPFLAQGSIAEPIEGTYDLVIAVDVLHHLEEQDALLALRHLAAAAPQLLFSVTSWKGDPRFYRTVRPQRWWLERLADVGLAPVPGFDASFIAPNALLVERIATPVDPRALTAFEALLRIRAGAQQNDTALLKAREELAGAQVQLAQARAASEALTAELAGVRLQAERLRRALHVHDEQEAARQDELRRHNIISALARQIEEQGHDIRCQAETLDTTIRHRDLLLSSTSWRLTAPLRRMITLLSRLRQRSPSP